MRLGRRRTLGSGALLLTVIASTVAAPPIEAGSLGVTASVKKGTLKVVGSSRADKITLRRGGPGVLAVEVGNDGSADFTFKLTSFTKIVVTGRGGNDALRINESKGDFTNKKGTTLDGGAGNDTVRGGSFSEKLLGGTEADTLVGGRGNDLLLAGDGGDLVAGGKGLDTARLGAGTDKFSWMSGDGGDVVDGDADSDVVAVSGGSGANSFAASENLGHVLLNADGVVLDIDDSESLLVDGGASGDTFVSSALGVEMGSVGVELGASDGAADLVTLNGTTAPDVVSANPVGDEVQVIGLGQFNITGSEAAHDRLRVVGGGDADVLSAGGLAPLIALTLDGGDGADTLNGGTGDDSLNGGGDADTIDGNLGSDEAFMDDGPDTFVWDPGDGSDLIEGGADADTLLFNGSAGAELHALSAAGTRARLTRNIGNIVMDMDDIETVVDNALGGADSITIDDLSATDVTGVDIDLGSGGVGDAAVDHVIVNGTEATDLFQALAAGPLVQVNGFGAQVEIENAEAANDRLTIKGLGGADGLTGGVLASLMALTLDGGDGDDSLTGGNGADNLLGGAGDDTIDGNQGNDTALMGPDADGFFWDPGDGSDVIEGQGDEDELTFNGSAGSEIFAASANGGRVLFTRNVGNIVMDLNDIEGLSVKAMGGSDLVTVNDLTPTDLDDVLLSLGVGGIGDGAADTVAINTTAGADSVTLSGSAGSVTIATSPATITLDDAEPLNDQLVLSAGGGADAVTASGLASTSVLLTLQGGTGNDVLVGSSGGDLILGEANDDVIQGGPGNDSLNGGTETDYIDGGSGTDSASNGETVVNVP